MVCASGDAARTPGRPIAPDGCTLYGGHSFADCASGSTRDAFTDWRACGIFVPRKHSPIADLSTADQPMRGGGELSGKLRTLRYSGRHDHRPATLSRWFRADTGRQKVARPYGAEVRTLARRSPKPDWVTGELAPLKPALSRRLSSAPWGEMTALFDGRRTHCAGGRGALRAPRSRRPSPRSRTEIY